MKQSRIKNRKTVTVESASRILEERDIDEMNIAEETIDTAIAVYDPMVFIPELKITAARATFLQRDSEEDEFEADWDGTALFESDGNSLRYIMMEQDDLLLTLHNRYRRNSDELLSLKAIVFDGVETMIETNYISDEEVIVSNHIDKIAC